MPAIRPISDLRNNFNEISELCHRGKEPVYITRNGVGDMVVISMAAYDEMRRRLELYRTLLDAERESAAGGKRATHREVMKTMRSRIADAQKA